MLNEQINLKFTLLVNLIPRWEWTWHITYLYMRVSFQTCLFVVACILPFQLTIACASQSCRTWITQWHHFLSLSGIKIKRLPKSSTGGVWISNGAAYAQCHSLPNSPKSDYIIGFVTPVISSNKSKKLTAYNAGTQYARQSLKEKLCLVCCVPALISRELLGFVWTDCWGN